jgi:hemerythrin-like domain-containing protein
MAATNHRPGKTKEKAEKSKDAIALLTADHETVRGLLSQMEETTARGSAKRTTLLAKIAKEVRIHAQIEEEIFYPAYKEAAKTQEEEQLFFEAADEHGLVKIVLPALEKMDPATVEFGAKAKVLKDLIEHHAEEEEEEMFPKAKKLLGKARLQELGERLEARKEELSGKSGDSRNEARTLGQTERGTPRPKGKVAVATRGE